MNNAEQQRRKSAAQYYVAMGPEAAEHATAKQPLLGDRRKYHHASDRGNKGRSAGEPEKLDKRLAYRLLELQSPQERSAQAFVAAKMAKPARSQRHQPR